MVAAGHTRVAGSIGTGRKLVSRYTGIMVIQRNRTASRIGPVQLPAQDFRRHRLGDILILCVEEPDGIGHAHLRGIA